MNSYFQTRRQFSARLVSFLSAVGMAGTGFGATGGGDEGNGGVLRSGGTGVQSHSAQNDKCCDALVRNGQKENCLETGGTIHQEVVFKASRKRVYEALTDAKQFTKVTEFSMVKNAPPAEISREAGGAFSCFGGYISGRHVELVPNERIVQAWRSGSWDAGVYSIARFELKEQGAETKLVFDDTGFPNGEGEHLAAGWKMNYWEALQKYLAGQA